MYNFVILLFCCFTLHNSEVPITIAQPQIPHEPQDTELKQFGNSCYQLPYSLWINVLDFLLGLHHDVHYTIDPRVISDLYHSNKAKIGNGGRLIFCYKDYVCSWCPHGKHVARKTWHAKMIHKGWTFDRLEHGSVVLLNDAHHTIRVLDDTLFKIQAHYYFPQNSYFHVANHGQTMVHCAHPLIPVSTYIAVEPGNIIPTRQQVYSPIKSLHVMRHKAGTKTIQLPEGSEVMPPITLDEAGKLLAVHATKTDTVYVVDLDAPTHTTSTVIKVPLSQRSLSDGTVNGTTVNYAGWILIHPETYQQRDFMMGSYLYPFPRHIRFIYDAKIRPNSTKCSPHQPCYFYQNQDFIGDLTLMQASKTSQLISLSQVGRDESDTKKHISTITINSFDITTGKKTNLITLSAEKTGIATYAASKTNTIVLCAGKICHIATMPTKIRPLASSTYSCLCKDAQQCHAQYRQGALISPSGYWVLRYEHIDEFDEGQFTLLPPRIFYLGGARMKLAMAAPLAYRTLMMRLYLLQKSSELGAYVQPPDAMQDALGMKNNDTPQKLSKSSSCIIS